MQKLESGQVGNHDRWIREVNRRAFLQRTSAAAIIAAAPAGLAQLQAGEVSGTQEPESLVKLLFESFTPKQRETVCFGWAHEDDERGLLRSRVAANWMITKPTLNSEFYTGEQRELVKGVLEGIIEPSWHERIYQQQQDDSDGFGEHSSIALFGRPDKGKFELVLTGRHMTLRCDGNSTEHVAFGGPIFYGHAPKGFREAPDHPGNVFWHQAQEANRLYQALDGKQQEEALVREALPKESSVGFRAPGDSAQGILVGELSQDQQQKMQEVLQVLIEPYRQTDRDEVIACLNTQGGLEACRLAFYAQKDIGDDQVWDNWRLEGPSFVWHYRGSPHVHVWVNVADNPSVPLNA